MGIQYIHVVILSPKNQMLNFKFLFFIVLVCVFKVHKCACVCVSVYLPENEDLVPTSYIQRVDAPPNVDVHGLGR